MKRKGLWIIAGIVVLVLIVVILLPLLFNANRYRPEIESRLSQSLGRSVKIGSLRLSLFSGGITANDISIADDPAFSREPFVTAKSLEVGVELMPLIFHQQLTVQSLVLDQPTVRLLQSSAGKWNVSTIGQKQGAASAQPPAGASNTSAPGQKQGASGNAAKKQSGSSGPSEANDISIGKLEVNDGRLEVGQANAKPQAYTALNVKATGLSYAKSFPFSLSMSAPQGGKLKIEGNAGPINPSDSSRTPFNGNVTIDNFDLAATGFVSPESGLAGILNYKGKITSDGRTLRSQGQANATKLRLVKTGSSSTVPVAVDYHSDYDLARDTGTVSQTTIHSGKSTAALSGNYNSQGPNTNLDLHLLGNGMNPQDIEGLLPAMGVVLPAGSSLQGGTLNADLNLRGPSDRLVTTGTVKLANTRLAGFSMSKGLSSIAALAGLHPGSDTSIQLLSSGVRVAPEGMRFDNLNLVVPELGSMTGAGTIGADSSLNFHLVAKLNTSGNALGLVTAALGSKAGPKSIPIQVTGTTSKPVFMPDVGSAVAGQLVPSAGASQQQNPIGGIIGGLLGNKKKK